MAQDRHYFAGGQLHRAQAASRTRAIELADAAAWHPVTSSNIRAVCWRSVGKQTGLGVWFLSGTSYFYPSAPHDVYVAMMAAPSKGKYLNGVVIPNYPHVGPFKGGV